jgi:hypothetical protein
VGSDRINGQWIVVGGREDVSSSALFVGDGLDEMLWIGCFESDVRARCDATMRRTGREVDKGG